MGDDTRGSLGVDIAGDGVGTAYAAPGTRHLALGTVVEMPEFGRFFLPGPTEVRPEVLAAMTRPVIGHRGSEMSRILGECDPVLRALFRTSRPVWVSSSSATGMMEAAVRNGIRGRALA